VATPVEPGTPPEHGPRSTAPHDLGFVPRRRLRWFAPGLLVRTGVQVAVSTQFAEFLDQRESQAAVPATTIDLPDEHWIDYASDCGDGFDAAATVASVIARDEVTLGGTRTEAGSVLVLGGDQAYPYASGREYRDRLVGPYRSMLPWTPRPRRLFAVPGNHDWYDGLSSFRKQFGQGRWIGGWKTAQTRSYFALDLPGPWTLWAIDIALGTDVDGEQLAWFRERAAALDPGAVIILCSAKPSWTDGDPEAYAALDYVEREVIGDRARLRVSLTGDSHHYARYEGPDGQQKITAGGGGAYLSPTHHLPPALDLPPPESVGAAGRPPTRYTLAAGYPAREESRRLRARIAGRIFDNGLFWLLVSALYLLGAVAWARTVLALTGPGAVTALPVLSTAVLTAALILGLVGFARSSAAPGRRTVALGLLHAVAHAVVLTGAVLLAGLSPEPWRETTALGAAALAGAVAGPLVVAAYLQVADALGVNSNELFSALGRDSHRCFLRLHISPDDDRLTIYPVRIERSARWTFTPGTDGTRRWFDPDAEPVAELIEDPIVVLP